jgi:hypothetical protein
MRIIHRRRPMFGACIAAVSVWLGLTVAAFAQDEPELDEPGPAEPGAAEPGVDEPGVAEQEAEEQGLDEQAAGAEPLEAGASLESEIYRQESESEGISSGSAGTGPAAVDQKPREPSGGLGVTVGFFTKSDGYGSSSGLLPAVAGWMAIGGGWQLDLDWAVGFRNFWPEWGDTGSNTLVVADPQLTLLHTIEGGRTSIHYGLGVAAPIYDIPAENDRHFWDISTTYELISAMEGRWNHWRWMPEHFTIVVPVSARMVAENHVLVGGGTSLACSIPTGDYKNDRADIYWQLAGEVGFRWDTVETGMRLRAVTEPVKTGDKLQVSIGPFVRLDLEGGYLKADFLLNLDSPYGVFGSGGDDVWGLFLGGGVDF